MLRVVINIILSSILFICFSVYSQENNPFKKPESKIKSWFDIISTTKDDSLKLAFNDSILNTFDTILVHTDSYYHTFSSLNFAGKIISPDELFRIINWNLVFNDGTYKYYGYIQYYNKKEMEVKLFPLTDKSEEIISPKQALLTNENWFGALYYKIIVNKYGTSTFYTLLGWDGNNDFTNIKLIEVLYFTRSGKPKFGKNIFKIDNEKMKRVIFEYNNRAILTLRYDEYLDMIVYEHLSPAKPSQIGQYKFYIPDFSYDGLEFKNGKFIHHASIDVHDRQQKNKRKFKELNNKRKSISF